MASRGSSAWRLEAWGSPCNCDLVTVPIYAGGPKFQCNRFARDAFIMLGAVFLRCGYIVRRAGGYNCRLITGGKTASSHAYGLSSDINDDTNPYRLDKLVTDMLGSSGTDYSMIQAVYDIKTIDGVQVFRWGGDWDGRPDTRNSNYDAMHFEIICTPDELARGFTHQVPTAVDNPTHYPVIRRGARGPLVVQLQDLLGLERVTGNGTFGPRTEIAVKIYQRERGLEADGIVGHATWTALLTRQPVLPGGAIGPQKLVA